MRPLARIAPASVVLRALRAGAAACLLVAVSPAIAAPSRPTSNHPVTTGRGEFNLVIYRAVESPGAPAKPKPLVLLLSGEGGWRAFDDMIAGWLADAGFWVGGFDAKAYFNDPQDDRQLFANDLKQYAAVLAKAAGRPPVSPVLLLGFSFGADLAPWVAGAKGWDAGHLAGLVMLGPDETGSTQFRWGEMMGLTEPTDHVFDMADALKSAAGVPMLFVHGGSDSKSSVPKLLTVAPDPKDVVVVPGANHHFSGREDDLRIALLDGIARLLAKAPAR